MDKNAKPHKPEYPPFTPDPDGTDYDIDHDPNWNSMRVVLLDAIYNGFSGAWLFGRKKDS